MTEKKTDQWTIYRNKIKKSPIYPKEQVPFFMSTCSFCFYVNADAGLKFHCEVILIYGHIIHLLSRSDYKPKAENDTDN